MPRRFVACLALFVPLVVMAQARVVAPGHDETVHSNTGDVPVIVADAAAGLRFRPVLDGVVHAAIHDVSAFEIGGVERGAHRLAVELIDADGRVVGRTPEIEFHLWQASRLLPARRR